jgi:hypothetical protein
MNKIMLIFFLWLTVTVDAFAQKLPVISATSKYVKIRDGANFKQNYWVIFPEVKPDIYYVDLPQKNQKVTFITDKDSISFELK